MLFYGVVQLSKYLCVSAIMSVCWSEQKTVVFVELKWIVCYVHIFGYQTVGEIVISSR